MSDEAALRRERILAMPLERVGTRPGFITGASSSWRELWTRRDLIAQLTSREIRAKYKNSSLGILWSLFKPLAQLLIYYFAIGEVLGVARVIPGFAIFVFIGLTGWTLFTDIVSRGTGSIVSNAGLIKKIYLPREVFPLAGVGGAIFTFLIQFAVLLAAMLVFRQLPWTWDIGYAVLGVMVLLVFGTALALLLAALNVYFRDTEHLLEVVLVVMFWVSPIVYSYAFVHNAIGGTWLEAAYLSNPVTLGVLGMQHGLWAAGDAADSGAYWPPQLALLLWIALAVGCVLLFIGQRVFARAQGNFAQEL